MDRRNLLSFHIPHDDASEDCSTFQDKSIIQHSIRRSNYLPELAYSDKAHSNHLAFSMRYSNGDFGNPPYNYRDNTEFEADKVSICHIESDNEFVPNFHPEGAALLTVFNEKELMSRIEGELPIITAQIEKMLTNFDPSFSFFKITREEKKITRKLSVVELQEKINQLNLIKEKSKISITQDEEKVREQRAQDQFPSNMRSKINAQQSDIVGCRCKKTHCLKLYCECFIKGEVCSPSCKCQDCLNLTANDEMRKMILSEHFEKGTIRFDPTQTKSGVGAPAIEKTPTCCSCGKTGCNKKYCECYRLQKKCSALCTCKDCKNGKEEGTNNEEEVIKHRKVATRRKKGNFLNNIVEKMKFNKLLKEAKTFADKPDKEDL